MVFYAVRVGRKPGIYKDWDTCLQQVNKYSGAIYKKFNTLSEAQSFIGKSTSSFAIKSITHSHTIKWQSQRENSAYVMSPIKDNSSSSANIALPFMKEANYPDWHIVYTDGACRANGKKGSRAGVGVYWGPEHPWNVGERWTERQTNNDAEIGAACVALRQAHKAGIKKIILRTDSQFLISCITNWIHQWHRNGWKLSNGGPVKVEKQIKELWKLWKENDIEVKWEYVKAHSGDHGNEAADALAVIGALLDQKAPI